MIEEPAAGPSGDGNAPTAPALDAPSHARRSKRYQRYKMALGAAEWAVEMAVLAAFFFSGGSVALREAVGRISSAPSAMVLLYLIPVGIVLALISSVFGAVRTFRLDRRFGLSTQSVESWAGDEVKGWLVGGLLWLVAIEALYALLRWFPDTWWLWATVAFSFFFVVLAHLAPILIFPLFFRFTPITDPEITGRLERLAKKAGRRVRGVYEVNLSRKTRAANAALVGFGRTRRILLADNLLDNFTLDEIEAVLAHEFAHHAHRHLPKAALIQTATFFLLFGGLHLILEQTGGRWGLQGIADVANLPFLALAATAIGLAVLPATNAILRSYERAADAYALQTAARPEALCSALERLAQLNLADKSPHPLIEWIFYSHPSISRRVDAAKRFLQRSANGG
ncbi:MAG: M48 family metallopeptidase [Candidatus Sumerlaeia bacterium]|nr:M48 family metallopeptidase [Candidatus Sumerlaeia bacterium]